MFTAAEKTSRPAQVLHTKEAGHSSLLYKKGEDPFFAPAAKESFVTGASFIQAKLSVSQPGDPHEKEADAMADQVMNMAEPMHSVGAVPHHPEIHSKEEEQKIHPKQFDSVQRKEEPGKCAACEEHFAPMHRVVIDRKDSGALHRLPIQRQGRDPPAISSSFEHTLSSTKGSGTPMAPSEQQFMESRFSADFSGVRIHTDSTAQSLNRDVHAQAFTHGNDIYFSSGKFEPQSASGGFLLAHELTHTIQQGASKPMSASSVAAKKSSSTINPTSNTTSHDLAAKGNMDPVNSKEEGLQLKEEIKPEQKESTGSSKLSRWSVSEKGALQNSYSAYNIQPSSRVQKKESEEKEIKKKDNYAINRTAAAPMPAAIAPQQRGPPTIQRWSLSGAWDSISGFASEIGSFIEKGLDAAKNWVLDKISTFLDNIPGYKLAGFILGHDPVTKKQIEKTPVNLLDAVLALVPIVGPIIRPVLDYFKATTPVANWLYSEVGKFMAMLSSIGSRFIALWDRLSIGDLKNPQRVIDDVANLFTTTVRSIFDFAVDCGSTFLTMVKDIAISNVVDFVVKYFPNAFDLLCVVLGENPINKKPVERNGTNIMNAGLKVLGEEGAQIKEQMIKNGIFQKCVAWIDKAKEVVTTSVAEIKEAFSSLWSTITFDSLLHPIDTFNMIVEKFKTPVTRVGAFIKESVIALLKILRDALLNKLSAFAKETKGYFLLTVIIGKDPFTGAAVEFSAENLIHGFMSLMDGGEEQFQQMKASGSIDKTTARITAAVKKLGFTWAYVVGLFTHLWESLTWKDFLNIIGVFKKIIHTFAQPIIRLVEFIIEIIKIVIGVILEVMQFPVDLVRNIIAKAMLAFDMIKKDPIGFLKNLLRAIKEGFVQFFDHIAKHLLAGLMGWLTSELKDAGVKAPEDTSLKGIISWVLVILGITMEKIWERLAKHPKIGPAKVAKIRSMINTLEGIWAFIKDVQERGVTAIWDKIKEQLSNLWDMVLGSIKKWIMDQIIGKIVTKLLSMLDPTGIMAVINSAIALYKAVQSFLKYLVQMLQIVNSFVEGIVEIASGNTKRAADFLESTLARGVPIVIGFLANQLGLDGIGKRIGELIGDVRELVVKAIDWLIDKAVTIGGKLLEMGKAAVQSLVEWWKAKTKFKANDQQEHTISYEGSEQSAILTVRSQPKPYTLFLEAFEKDNKDLQGERLTAFTLAKAKALDIEKIKNAPLEGTTEEDKKASSKAKAAVVQTMVVELGEISKPLFGAEKPDIKDVMVTGNGNTSTFATEMVAERIFNSPDVVSKGSAPTSDSHKIYDKIDQRKKGKASYYIRGHLLNQNLGGPGEWKFLTALTRSGNSMHESSVESIVKAAFNIGGVLSYKVTASGKQKVKSPAEEDKPAFSKIAPEDINTQFPILKDIIAAEEQVPSQLACSASLMTKEGNEWKATKEILPQTIVNNEIDTDFGSYELGNSPPVKKVDLGLGKNLSQLASALDYSGDKQNLADKIIRMVKHKTKEYTVPGFGTYEDLVNYKILDATNHPIASFEGAELTYMKTKFPDNKNIVL